MKRGQGCFIQRAISFNQGLYCIFCKKVRWEKEWKKENPPQDLARLCCGAKGQLMNYGWRRNGNQFLSQLSQTPPPVALEICPYFLLQPKLFFYFIRNKDNGKYDARTCVTVLVLAWDGTCTERPQSVWWSSDAYCSQNCQNFFSSVRIESVRESGCTCAYHSAWEQLLPLVPQWAIFRTLAWVT